MEPWGDADAHNGSVEAQNGAMERLRPVAEDSHHFEKQDPDPN